MSMTPKETAHNNNNIQLCKLRTEQAQAGRVLITSRDGASKILKRNEALQSNAKAHLGMSVKKRTIWNALSADERVVYADEWIAHMQAHGVEVIKLTEHVIGKGTDAQRTVYSRIMGKGEVRLRLTWHERRAAENFVPNRQLSQDTWKQKQDAKAKQKLVTLQNKAAKRVLSLATRQAHIQRELDKRAAAAK